MRACDERARPGSNEVVCAENRMSAQPRLAALYVVMLARKRSAVGWMRKRSEKRLFSADSKLSLRAVPRRSVQKEDCST